MIRIPINEYCSFVFTLLYYGLIVYIYAAPEINCSINDLTTEGIFVQISKINNNLLNIFFPKHGSGLIKSYFLDPFFQKYFTGEG